MGSKAKLIFENRVINEEGIEVRVEELSEEEKSEAAAWWYERFMGEMGYVKEDVPCIVSVKR